MADPRRPGTDLTDMERVTVPAPPTKPSSLRRLAELAATVPESADLVILGDSLAAAWPAEDLLRSGACRHPFNCGLPGDRIANTLWRLGAMPIGHLRPRALVLLLGTNNLGDGDPPAAIAAGLRHVAERCLALWSPHVLVAIGLPWRRPGGVVREADRLAVNGALAAILADLRGYTLDPDPILGAGPDETAATVLPDGLHLAAAAYPRLAAALAKVLTAREIS